VFEKTRTSCQAELVTRGDGSLLPRQQLRKYECDGRGEKHKNHGCNESTRDELLAGRHRMVGIFRGHVAF